MGRNAAGEAFLKGFFKYSTAKEFFVQADQQEHVKVFEQTARLLNRHEPVTGILKNDIAALHKAGLAFYSGPNLGRWAQRRSFFGHNRWSVCGITHTVSSASAMDGIADLITAPIQEWDALICTSSAVRQVVERLLKSQADYLRDRLGLTRLTLPQLPVIPLGVHPDDFRFSATQRQEARSKIGADDETMVVLFVGRLSFHAKAHPLAMYQALESACQRTQKKVVLLEYGRHANEHIATAFRKATEKICSSLRVLHIDGHQDSERNVSWAASDIFCSLSDNIQESFGLTPIEAMAAGLPCVVSDWNGYKDTVRDGIDGFRIPTLQPAAGVGLDLAARHALEMDSYDMYIGHASSLTSIDIHAASEAFVALFAQPELRKAMGESARQRAAEVFDWKVIIAQYEDLWGELAKARPTSLVPQPWASRMDPFVLFASYSTDLLHDDVRLQGVEGNALQAIESFNNLWQLSMVNYARAILPTESELIVLLKAIYACGGQRQLKEILLSLPEKRRIVGWRGIASLLKLGLIRRI